MKALNWASALVILFAIIAVILRLNTVRVPIGKVGVRTVEFGPSKGLSERDYAPGFHLDIGPLHTWELFDTTVQTLSMVRNEGEAIPLKSADGQTVTLDITIKYKINPGHAWELRRDLGVGDSYKSKVKNEAVDALRPILGTMRTAEFYNPATRAKKSDEAEAYLRKRLENYHVELIAILVRDVTFTDTYESQIKAKALKGQEREVADAQKEAAGYRGETQKIIAESTAKVTVIRENLEKTRRELTAENEKEIAQIRADADKYVIEQRADADLYQAEKLAAATRLVKNAEAEAERLRQVALKGPGARNLVALEAAKNLNLTTLVISTMDNNVLDLAKFAEQLGSESPTTGGN